MKLLCIFSILVANLAFVGAVKAQTTDALPVMGPNAALFYAGKTCCLRSTLVDFSQTKNIIPMSENLWTHKQIIQDFKKNRTPDQVAPIVIIKTEYCIATSELCAITTAVFEKQATAKINSFRVYGAWLYRDMNFSLSDDGWTIRNVDGGKGITSFDRNLIQEYSFKQGPGANIIFLNPSDGSEMYRTSAQKLKLDASHFMKNEGTVPLLDKALDKVLKMIAERSSPVN